MKKILKGFAIFLTALVILFAGLFLWISRGLDENSQPVLTGVSAEGAADGEHSGFYDGGRWTNRVKVTVAGGQITDIALTQDVMFKDPKVSEELFQRVIAQQTTQVDAVSGSTVTSRAYLKAIENALTLKEE
jgi:uncharacterized protein with FMN-binding domain